MNLCTGFLNFIFLDWKLILRNRLQVADPGVALFLVVAWFIVAVTWMRAYLRHHGYLAAKNVRK